MIKLLTTLTKKNDNKKPNNGYPNLSKDDLQNLFYSSIHHQWILTNRYIKASFDEFWSLLPLNVCKEIIFEDYKFIYLEGQYSCAFDSKNIIIIFPELYEMMAAFYESSYKAVLAHEIGHLIRKHSHRNLSSLEAQVEADAFVAEIGLASDLESFLLSQGDNIEAKVRLSYLTSAVLSKEF